MHIFPRNILCKTSTRADGNMSFRIGDVRTSLQNRKQFLLRHNVDFANHICMRCNHGEQISPVNWTNCTRAFGTTSQEEMLPAEVLITQEKGLALMLLTADCLPVSLYDPVTHTLALAHFSRETISKMLPQKTITFLQKHFGVTPATLLITIGPYIHTGSYTFPSDDYTVQSQILPFTKEKDKTILVDLVAACTHQLSQQGVDIGNIRTSDINTSTSPDHFSHHASRTQNAQEGRLATIVMMR